MFKISDNLSIVTSEGISFNGTAFSGTNKAVTEVFGKAESNTAIISDKAGNSMYVM